jgi:hypothetical protein
MLTPSQPLGDKDAVQAWMQALPVEFQPYKHKPSDADSKPVFYAYDTQIGMRHYSFLIEIFPFEQKYTVTFFGHVDGRYPYNYHPELDIVYAHALKKANECVGVLSESEFYDSLRFGFDYYRIRFNNKKRFLGGGI